MGSRYKIKKNLIKNKDFQLDKYDNRAGCYCIYIDDKLVYIGKSMNIFERIAAHIYNMDNNKRDEHKYHILNEARTNGNKISFDVIYYANKTDVDEARKDISINEEILIQKYLPPLNYLVKSDSENPVHNEDALTITLNEILMLDSVKIESAYKE